MTEAAGTRKVKAGWHGSGSLFGPMTGVTVLVECQNAPCPYAGQRYDIPCPLVAETVAAMPLFVCTGCLVELAQVPRD